MMNQYPVEMEVERKGVKYKVIDFRFDGVYLYDLREIDGDGEMNDIPEDELSQIILEERKMTIFIVTAIGVAIDTEVRIAYTEDEAKDIAKGLLNDFKVDSSDVQEMCHNCWKGYSVSANCDVEIEIHEKEIEK